LKAGQQYLLKGLRESGRRSKESDKSEMFKTILYTDGGCAGNEQPNWSKRKMVAVVSNEQGHVLIDRHQEGGSNNIAEFLAVKEALLWCVANKIGDVEIRTDSRNNLAWVLGRKVGKKLNDRDAVLDLKAAIDACRSKVNLTLTWIPREQNPAGQYMEHKYHEYFRRP
jgi:ribonuclease HI